MAAPSHQFTYLCLLHKSYLLSLAHTKHVKSHRSHKQSLVHQSLSCFTWLSQSSLILTRLYFGARMFLGIRILTWDKGKSEAFLSPSALASGCADQATHRGEGEEHSGNNSGNQKASEGFTWWCTTSCWSWCLKGTFSFCKASTFYIFKAFKVTTREGNAVQDPMLSTMLMHVLSC